MKNGKSQIFRYKAISRHLSSQEVSKRSLLIGVEILNEQIQSQQYSLHINTTGYLGISLFKYIEELTLLEKSVTR